MRQVVVGIVLLALFFATAPASAGIVSLDEALAEKVIGRDDAPVTVIEYSSLTCPHCASFHRETLPAIKKAYIDTGKVRLVYRDFPLGGLALAAAMLARCAGEQKFFGLIEVLLRSQQVWARSDNPRKELLRIARFGGLGEDDFEQCLDNEALMKGIQEQKAAAIKKYDIESTPTFIIDGQKVSGALSLADFQDILDKAVEKKR